MTTKVPSFCGVSIRRPVVAPMVEIARIRRIIDAIATTVSLCFFHEQAARRDGSVPKIDGIKFGKISPIPGSAG